MQGFVFAACFLHILHLHFHLGYCKDFSGTFFFYFAPLNP